VIPAAPEHLGFVVADLDAAMAELERLGHRWSSVRTPQARILRNTAAGRAVHGPEVTTVRYVVTSGPLPRLKLIEEVRGTFWERDGGHGPHHLTYWVDDLEAESAQLIASGARPDADGLESDGSVRYRYLILATGIRIELSRRPLRDEFEEWATSG
jgi:hypothetical protein